MIKKRFDETEVEENNKLNKTKKLKTKEKNISEKNRKIVTFDIDL